jgi:hypothetical protein
MNEWLVSLKGADLDLEYLSSEFVSGACSIVKEGTRYYLRSVRFSLQTEASDVRDSATELLRVVNGLAAVRSPDFEAVELGDIAYVDDEGQRHSFSFIIGIVSPRTMMGGELTLVESDDTVALSQRRSETETWLQIANEEPAVVDGVSRFGSRESSPKNRWYDLYWVYEIMRRDVGRKHILERGWATRSIIEAFTRTANHYYRHPPGASVTPPRPMSLSAAEALIRHLLRAWLDQQCQERAGAGVSGS